MSTYLVATCNSGWFVDFAVQTDDVNLLERYCQIAKVPSPDACTAYEKVPAEAAEGYREFTEEELQAYVEYAYSQYRDYGDYEFDTLNRFEQSLYV